MAVGALPEQVDQVGEVRQVIPSTQQNTQIQAESDLIQINYVRTNDVWNYQQQFHPVLPVWQ